MDIPAYAILEGGTGKRGCHVLKKISNEAGCSAETLYMIGTGNKRAGHVLAAAIEQATGGKVTRHELRPDIWPPQEDARHAA